MVKQKKFYCPFVSIILFLLYDGNSWDKGMNTTLRSNVWSDNHRAVSFVVMYRTLFVLEKYFKNRILMCKHLAKKRPKFLPPWYSYPRSLLLFQKISKRNFFSFFKSFWQLISLWHELNLSCNYWWKMSYNFKHSLILATSFVHCGTLLILNNFDSVVKCFSI